MRLLTLLAALVSVRSAYAQDPAGVPETRARRAGEALTLATVGHVVMGTDLGTPRLPAGGPDSLFGPALPELAATDLTFGNLAAPLSARGASSKDLSRPGVYAFRTPPAFAPALLRAGFDVMQVANNHVRDAGMLAYEDTLATLRGLGIGTVGLTDGDWEATRNGLRVAVTGFTQPYVDRFRSHHDVEAAAAHVRALAARSDVVIVGVHGGTEGPGQERTPQGREYLGGEYRGEVVRLAHALVDAGADLVVGFGPHALRGMEHHGDGLIAYGLGNFVVHGPFNLAPPRELTIVLETAFDAKGRLVRATAHPMRIGVDGVPVPDPTGAALAHLRAMGDLDFPRSAARPDAGGELLY